MAESAFSCSKGDSRSTVENRSLPSYCPAVGQSSCSSPDPYQYLQLRLKQTCDYLKHSLVKPWGQSCEAVRGLQLRRGWERRGTAQARCKLRKRGAWGEDATGSCKEKGTSYQRWTVYQEMLPSTLHAGLGRPFVSLGQVVEVPK